ncbi:MAG TPA: hypothetical protein VG755_30415 [Nannocystaceae bacterium]|nr:hypothetical protein [Nannocystaceae bacterium]
MEPFFSHVQQFMAAIQQAQQLGATRIAEALDESARLGKASLAMWTDLSRAGGEMWRQSFVGWTPPANP